MGAQEKTEEVLRNIHLLFQKAEPYNGSSKRVIVDKGDLMELLKELNDCIYDMQEEYEMTAQSRDRATRRTQKEGEEIIFESQQRADDVYAGAILYTDNALHEIQDIIQETNEEIHVLTERLHSRLREAKENVRTNQTELKATLQDLVDTQKYLRLIEDENRRRAKEEARKAARIKSGANNEDPLDADDSKVGAAQPQIRINTDFLTEHGFSVGDDEAGEAPADTGVSGADTEAAFSEAASGITEADARIKLPDPPAQADYEDADTVADSVVKLTAEELDAEYFAWQDESAAGEKDGGMDGLKDQFKEIFKK